MTAALTHDGFLDGRVRAWQPRVGYRAATDPVFLAAACPAMPGDRVLELGCGAGVASLCLSARVANLAITGVERQRFYADLARRNVVEAGVDMRLVEADLTALPKDLRQESFDHVIANAPYYGRGAGTPASDDGREAALREDTPLADWITTAKARLKPKGWLTLIQAADRLPDALCALQQGLGSISVRPLAPRSGRPAGRVLIRARKGGKAAFVLMAPIIIHEHAEHLSDGDDYSPLARAILRDGAAVPSAHAG